MLKFRATSTRVTDGHGANCFSDSEEVAHTWAKAEMAGGYDSVVYEVKEVVVAEYKIPKPALCSRCGRPLEEGRADCRLREEGGGDGWQVRRHSRPTASGRPSASMSIWTRRRA